MSYQYTPSIARYGTSGVAIRSRNVTTPLTLDEIHFNVPSLLAEEKHSSRSDKFSFISTRELLDRMATAGFFPFAVRQGGTRDEGKRAYTKHLVNFRRLTDMQALAINDTFFEVAVGNAHDGTSAYWFCPAMFKLACLNGMYTPMPGAEDNLYRVSHRGNVSDVIDATFRVVDQFDNQRKAITDMSQIVLNRDEQLAFAESAASLRFGEHQHVHPRQLLTVHRQADANPDLWSTFNVVQENVIQGGVTTESRHVTDGEVKYTHRRSRPVQSIGDNVRLNQALWTLAERMREIKQTA